MRVFVKVVFVLYMEKVFNFAGTTVKPFNTQNSSFTLQLQSFPYRNRLLFGFIIDKRLNSMIEKLGKIIIFYLYLSRICLIITASIW